MNLDKFENQTKNITKNSFIFNFSNENFEKKLYCLKNYPFPKNYDPNNLHARLKAISNEKLAFLSGSYIQFSCLNGYFLSSYHTNLTTYCLADNTWSDVGDCELTFIKSNKNNFNLFFYILPGQYSNCLASFPERPLNGRRDIVLEIDRNYGVQNGSHIKIKCNRFFRLYGREKLSCINGVWQNETTKCHIVNELCTKKPKLKIGSASLVSYSYSEIKNEYELNRFNNVIIYTEASYTCPENRFQNGNKKIQHRIINNKKVSYIMVYCIGQDIWETISCLK